MKLHQYGNWTIYVIQDRKPFTGYRAITIEGHQNETTLPKNALIYAHITNGQSDQTEYVVINSDFELIGHARYTLYDAIKHLSIYS